MRVTLALCSGGEVKRAEHGHGGVIVLMSTTEEDNEHYSTWEGSGRYHQRSMGSDASEGIDHQGCAVTASLWQGTGSETKQDGEPNSAST